VEHQRDSQCVLCNLQSKSIWSILLCWRKLYWHDISGHVANMAKATIAKHTDVHIPARRKSRPLRLWGSSVPEHTVTRTLDRACVWKWPTTVAMAPEVPWSYALWFFLGGYVKDRVFVPPLPCDLADLKTRIIEAAKNIDAPMLTRVWQELKYRIDVCRVTRGAHIEHL
jgi:hypothetical protein